MKKAKLDWKDFPACFFVLFSIILGGAYIFKLEQTASEVCGKIKNLLLSMVAFVGVLFFLGAAVIGNLRSLIKT